MSTGQRVVTFYYLVLALGNAWMTWFIPNFIKAMRPQWRHMLEDRPLPESTEILLDYKWWPLAFFIYFLIAGLISLLVPRFRNILLHGLVLFLILECVIVFGMMIACVDPCLDAGRILSSH